ncbi:MULTISPECIES: cobalt ECF transporter T component CbiQ [unclassified Leptolyngbya]|uniref:cobalt ECF transporter T component CbiQ n=1 Tax=unclassified Leptolyngbya TaxID=2650499 RepID=UPI0016831368|nr:MULTISPECIES: cobalt ECF transporter T component CbiQ [unclassified Leptolyngbya]MBD1911546.1 cobalt ECF transporter T component CbiQ [Leptolyngbya sp. FACHB-8]MBD2155580.1 cobalt ECF transporter T component CbiQ [Leptolyngbya sp. FACHB-16]
MALFHTGVFHLDQDSQLASPWHRLVAPSRVLCALLFVFATSLTPNGYWAVWGVYGLGLLLLLLLSRVNLGRLLRRVGVESVFLGAVLLGTLFRDGGTVLWQWGWLRITSEGLMVLGSVGLKSLLSLMMLNLLVLTTPVPDLLQALVTLKMPPLLVSTLAAMYRYTALLVGEFATMRRAAASRNLMNRQRYQRLVIGNMIGALFIRTYERGDRIHQAMLARGYTGLPPLQTVPQSRWWDGVAIALTLTVLIVGQALHWYGTHR